MELCLWLLCALPALAQSGLPELGDDTSVDKPEPPFAERDPYSGERPEDLKRAGIRSLGPFEVLHGRSSDEVARDLGGIDLIWIETAHFKLGSTLGNYKSLGDARERDRLKVELERLAQRLPAVKARTKELDPWLRAHLYAQRLEELYAEFLRLTGFFDGDFPPSTAGTAGATGRPHAMGSGPYLGRREKFLVLLTTKRSTFARFMQLNYAKFPQGSQGPWAVGPGFFGCAAETIKRETQALDVALWCYTANGVTHNFLEGLRDSDRSVPVWFVEGMAHVLSRRIDPRWMPYGGDSANSQRLEGHYDWEPRVRAIVQGGQGTDWKTMMARADLEAIPNFEHMLLWSRAEFLLEQGPPRVREYLMGVTEGGYPDRTRTPPEQAQGILLERQERAQAQVFGRDPSALERDWTQWVKARYRRD